MINKTAWSIWTHSGKVMAGVTPCQLPIQCPRCDPNAETLSESNNRGLKEQKLALQDRKTRASRNQFSQDTADVFRWTLQAAFSSSPPVLLMLLIMISHQQGTFWHPPQRPPASHLSLRSNVALKLFLLTANIYYFWLCPQYSASSSRACPINLHILHGRTLAQTHIHKHTHTPAPPSII